MRQEGKNNRIFLIICLLILLVICVALALKAIDAAGNNQEKCGPDKSFLNVYGEKIKTPDNVYEYNNTVMAGNGKLFRTSDVLYEFNKKTEDKNIDDFIYIFSELRDDTQVLYVQRPCKYNRKTDVLPYGYTITLDKKYDYWCSRMRSANVPVLDLRKVNKKHNVFYIGDHHWTIETSYYAAKAISVRLSEEYPERYKFNNEVFNTGRFIRITRDGFIGEEAKRSDKLFMGSEKITFLVPSYYTEYDMYKYKDGKLLLHTSGRFNKALIDNKRLNEKETGKYNSSLFWTTDEARIYNHTINNKKKVLLIANSFGRSMAMYLSLGFQETRYIDPQKDRFNESIVGYIRDYDPDFVVVMLNQSIKKR